MHFWPNQGRAESRLAFLDFFAYAFADGFVDSFHSLSNSGNARTLLKETYGSLRYLTILENAL